MGILNNLLEGGVIDRLDSIAQSLSRIAGALDRAYPPLDLDRQAVMRKRGPEAIMNYGDTEVRWLKENVTELVRAKGLAPRQEEEMISEIMELPGLADLSHE